MRERSTGRIVIDPSLVARAEAEAIARKFGVEGREVPIILTLYAEAGYFRQGIVLGLSKFHKLLFYQWKRLETIGLGPAFLHDQFTPARGGPVSLHLKSDLEHLKKKGLVEVEWSESVTSPTVVRLTDEGMKLAERLWEASPEPIKDVTVEVKEDLYPMTGAGVREKVHFEYPDERRVYPGRARKRR